MPAQRRAMLSFSGFSDPLLAPSSLFCVNNVISVPEVLSAHFLAFGELWGCVGSFG